MPVTRRGFSHFALAGAVALGASTSFSRQSLAEAADQTAVKQALEAFRKALLDRDVDRLRDLLVEELSYGLWPEGAVQNKYEFISHIAREHPTYTSIAYSDPNTQSPGITQFCATVRRSRRILEKSATCWSSASYRSGKARRPMAAFGRLC
jgi:hypothetical protein